MLRRRGRPRSKRGRIEAPIGRDRHEPTRISLDTDTPRVEIGYTWMRASAQGTGANPDSKMLLMTHAFEKLGCRAVEFRTHFFNHQSRRGIELINRGYERFQDKLEGLGADFDVTDSADAGTGR